MTLGTRVAIRARMNKHHTAVWIDRHEARIFHIDAKDFEADRLRAHDHHVRRHPTQTAEHDHKPADSKKFHDEIAHALEGADEILIMGPSFAKLELVRHLREHQPGIEKKVVGIETVDHPTDGQLAAHARAYFHAVDRQAGLVP